MKLWSVQFAEQTFPIASMRVVAPNQIEAMGIVGESIDLELVAPDLVLCIFMGEVALPKGLVSAVTRVMHQ